MEMLYTHPHFRNSRIATNLKLALEQWTIEKDAHSIESTVEANNKQMRKDLK
ncbi:GNAT family N-acetyltransferase [Staphylococcus hominis]|uniref:GNAT family N-acetyltransferase n=1 Tax=Staphylococcus hominis TaxID=1290 RepID=UPI001E2B55EC|nr:GNAT family N-acetyltransferase [Staphylococcus hominis]MDO0979015.1 GNAT family N-acetyltransferase [Staphylococcus hominis]MDO0996891.1 GNAT family N-acetyltransferase [Staphylococcus hominis]MEB5575117.1 GNAT family N-acetyltransferase [Staphylococcus hominis]WRY65500.1 GNAT family N-acetyltransferase [Staphylococcus hominis]